MKLVITVRINDPSYEYDVRSLLRAFFSNVQVKVLPEQKALPGKPAESLPEASNMMLTIWMTEASVSLEWLNGRSWKRSVEAAGLERKQRKNCLKCLLYDVLAEDTGRTLPWGTLTGIRPTKLVRRMLREGKSHPEITAYMKQTYRTSRQKTDLAYQIACREQALIQTVVGHHTDTYSLYIGIPFCPSICLYCSFSSYPVAMYQDRVEDYLQALFREIDFAAEWFADRRLSTIYIGGGTPTALSASQLERLLAKVRQSFDLSGLYEWTVEAGRPDSLTREKLKVIRAVTFPLPVSACSQENANGQRGQTQHNGTIRISINPQTFQQRTLDVIGRRHTIEDVRNAFSMARETGIDCINMDLIVGLPGEGESEVADTLREVCALRPDNLTVHSLALKRASRLREEWNRYGNDAFTQSGQIMERVHAAAEAMDMQPYYLYRQKDIAGNLENIGFAPVGREGLYNILIMEEVQDIVALGAGAISKRVGCMDLGQAAGKGTGQESRPEHKRPVRTARAANVKDVDLYIRQVEEMMERKRRLFSK